MLILIPELGARDNMTMLRTKIMSPVAHPHTPAQDVVALLQYCIVIDLKQHGQL